MKIEINEHTEYAIKESLSRMSNDNFLWNTTITIEEEISTVGVRKQKTTINISKQVRQ